MSARKILTLLIGVAWSLSAPAEDIKTTAGAVYRNVSIEGVNPSGIDIGYTDAGGNYILRGLKFAELPEAMQKRFGYRPDISRQFDAGIGKYSNREMEEVAVTEKNRLETILKEVKQKLNGAEVSISQADLRYAAFALRRQVKIKALRAVRQGCVVKVMEVVSGKPVKGGSVLLDGVNLPVDGIWTGYIYPTGVQAACQGTMAPVFTDNVNRSAAIANKYLNIYAEYAASGNNDSAADVAAPEQMADDQSGQDSAGAVSPPAAETNNFNYTPDDEFGYTYCIGGVYYPVDWYWRHHHRPHPGPRPVTDFDRRFKTYGQATDKQEFRDRGAHEQTGGFHRVSGGGRR